MFYINTVDDLPDRYDIAKFLEYVTPDSGGSLFDVLGSYFWANVIFLPISGTYTVLSEANRPDLISYRIYGDTQYYWIIMIYNGIANNEDIQLGTKIYYPSLQDLDNLYFKLNSLQTKANAAESLAAVAPGPAATLEAITVAPVNSPTVVIGKTLQFTATGQYSDGTSKDLTTQVTWASSLTSVATINANGLTTGVAVGGTDIFATLGNISGGSTLSVVPVSVILSMIFISPAGQSVPHGSSIQFIATGIYSDSTTQDLTAQVTWDTSNHSIATIGITGFATTLIAGSVDIRATLGSVIGTIPLIVS